MGKKLFLPQAKQGDYLFWQPQLFLLWHSEKFSLKEVLRSQLSLQLSEVCLLVCKLNFYPVGVNVKKNETVRPVGLLWPCLSRKRKLPFTAATFNFLSLSARA